MRDPSAARRVEPVTCNGRVLVTARWSTRAGVVCRAYEQPLVVAVNLPYDLYGRAAVIKHSAGELVIERGRNAEWYTRPAVAP